MDDLALAERTGLPDPLRVLVAQYPRIGWEAHPHFTALTRFWLDRHLGFRRMQGLLAAETRGVPRPGARAARLRTRARAGRGQFLDELHGHHTIEDHHYFPLLKTLDPRLAAGFDLLDADHDALDGAMHALAEAANAVLDAVREGAPAEAAADAARHRAGALRAAARPAPDRRGGAGGAGDPRPPGSRARADGGSAIDNPAPRV